MEGSFWDLVLAFSGALAVIVSILGSILFILSKFGFIAKFFTAKQIKHRLETCPQKALCDIYDAKRDIKVHEIQIQLSETSNSNIELQGSHIVLFCIFAKYRKFLSRYERLFLHNIYENYEKKGGNEHLSVTEIYHETMALPEHEPKPRPAKKAKIVS